MAGLPDLDAPLRWRVVHGFHLLFVEAETEIPEDLWDACMDARCDPEVRGCLSEIDRGGFAGVSRHQWMKSASIMGARGYPVAVLSSHRVTIAMVVAAAWTGANVCHFKTTDLDLALDFIAVPQDLRADILDALEALREGREWPPRGCSVR